MAQGSARSSRSAAQSAARSSNTRGELRLAGAHHTAGIAELKADQIYTLSEGDPGQIGNRALIAAGTKPTS